MHDVFLTTGGPKLVGGGSDVWIRYWAKYIAPNLSTKSFLMVDRPDPDPSKPDFNIKNVKVQYRDNDEKWFKILEEARRIHILHMYYHERDTIKRFLSKIDSIVLHVCTEQTMKAASELGLPNNKFHHKANVDWENSLIPHIANPIWIGVNQDTPFHERYSHVKNIPNLYVFQNHSDLVHSDSIGFAARIESRKCPHYLEGMEALFFTSYYDLKSWENEYGNDFSNAKIYEFDWKYVDKFYSKKDWGIFHGCYRAEPFGYSIFQSLDHGKIPIIEKGWDPEFSYDYRADDKESFRRAVEKIRSKDYDERQEILLSARSRLEDKYGDPESWASDYLKIYNR